MEDVQAPYPESRGRTQTGRLRSLAFVGHFETLPDGTAHFDCYNTQDATGRCDHVAFAAGSLKEVKLNKDGSLHLATIRQGNITISTVSRRISRTSMN
jgi:hypothetical protein